MAESDDPRFQGAQFLGTVSDFAEFKKEKERKKAESEARRKLVENQDNRPDAKIIPFSGRVDKTTKITPEGLESPGQLREADIRSHLTEEELEKKTLLRPFGTSWVSTDEEYEDS